MERVQIKPEAMRILGLTRMGRGRPTGSLSKRTFFMDNVRKHQQEGDLPHELLLKLARGVPLVRGYDADGNALTDDQGNVLYWHPNEEERRDAMKAAAPYFAPKLSTVEVIRGTSDEDLLQLISGAAAAAGLVLSPDGTPEEADYAEICRIGALAEVERQA